MNGNSTIRYIQLVTATVVAGATLTACGGNSPNVVRAPTAPLTSNFHATRSPSPSPTSSTPTVHPKLIVTPSTGLHDKQDIRVAATGFSPGEALQVIQCADKGTNTGPGDCNLSGMQSATSDPNGRISTQLRVLRGPFGANNVVCSKQQPCLVSVTQASLSPTEEVDARVAFASG